MFNYAFMTCRLYVSHVFDEMFVMVRFGFVKSLIKFCGRGFFLVLFIVLESFIKFWKVVWRLALKKWLISNGRTHING